MASAARSTSPSTSARFAVEDLRVRDGELRVRGRWSGIRGLRFLRPTLIVEGRQVLATLEHKPWAPREDVDWVVAFPWDGDAKAAAGASMEVAPSVIVPLGKGLAAPSSRSERLWEARTAARREPVLGPLYEVPGPAPADPVASPLLASPAPVPVESGPREVEPAAARVPAAVPAAELRAVEAERDEQRRAARIVEVQRDRALEMRDEAVRDREAALRTRDRMVQQHDEAVAAAETAARDRESRVAEAERSVRAMRAERDEAREQRDVLRAQRDEVLVAHRSLEKVLDGERASRDRGAPVPTTGPAPAPVAMRPRELPPVDEDDDGFVDDEPLGVRAVPAASAVPQDLLSPRASGRPALGDFDRWALRVLAVTAASCFVLLLITLLNVFL